MHGLTEIVYAYASAANGNGSAFAGLAANTNWYNTTLGMALGAAFIRGLVRRRTNTLGSFRVDTVRSVTRILLPISFVFAILVRPPPWVCLGGGARVGIRCPECCRTGRVVARSTNLMKWEDHPCNGELITGGVGR